MGMGGYGGRRGGNRHMGRTRTWETIDVDGWWVVGCVEISAERRREPSKGNSPPPPTGTSTYRPTI